MRSASLVVVLVIAAAPAVAEDKLPPPDLLESDRPPLERPAPEAEPRSEPDVLVDADGIQPLNASVPLWSVVGCVAGGVLGPFLPLALAVPTAVYVSENQEPGADVTCVSALTLFACAGFGVAVVPLCSALGATLGGTWAASVNKRELWRPLVGGVPGVLCAVLSPLSCLCFPLPLGTVLAAAGLAVGMAGGPIAIAGASFLDAQLVERFGRVLRGKREDGDEDGVADQMHY